METELLTLLLALLGAVFALGYSWAKSRYENIPDFDELVSIAGAIVTAAKENHDLADNAARLDWAMEKLQKYLDAKGISKYFDARAIVEFALELMKNRG
jgi:hypothetical protein